METASWNDRPRTTVYDHDRTQIDDDVLKVLFALSAVHVVACKITEFDAI